MKSFKQGQVYLISEVRKKIKGFDMWRYETESGEEIERLDVEGDFEVVYKDSYKTEYVDPIYLRIGTLTVYRFIVPKEVIELSKKQAEKRRKIVW